jgi:hypothetical protein
MYAPRVLSCVLTDWDFRAGLVTGWHVAMSAMGQKQTSRHLHVMSALPPIADIRRCRWDVRFVPEADVEAEWDLVCLVHFST